MPILVRRLRTAGLLLASAANAAQLHLAAPARSRDGPAGTASCSSLANHGTHFTARISVGTPPQAFDLIADTGSSALIVPSCLCRDMNRCEESSKCFQGAGHSTTFSIYGNKMPTANDTVNVTVFNFASGQIQTITASDIVRVGEVSANMNNSLMLMTDQALDLVGPFEGILGLGVPTPRRPPPPAAGMSRKASVWQQWLHLGDQQTPTAPEAPEELEQKSFLESAGIGSFSMCFNEGSDGVLRLGGEADAEKLGSIGEAHWALDFHGISVGDAAAPVKVCGPHVPKAPGQATACGAIPDSGTTVIMGPEQHIQLLFGDICDRWPRCSRQKWTSPLRAKHEIFQSLLLSCGEWGNGTRGLEELPDLHFKVRGAEGKELTLPLPGPMYVFESFEDEVHLVTKRVMGIFPQTVRERTGRKKKVCLPAFGTHEYSTQKNGPIWVLGTPFFYTFQVGYDVTTTPPSMFFRRAPCGSCSTGQTSLYSLGSDISRAAAEQRRLRPRLIRTPLRPPSFGNNTAL